MWTPKLFSKEFVEDVWKYTIEFTEDTGKVIKRDFESQRLTDAIYQSKVAITIERLDARNADTTTIQVGDVIDPVITVPEPTVNQARIDRFRAKYGELRQLQILKSDGLFLDSREVDDAAIATLQGELNGLSKANKREVYGI